ncbi:MAG: SusC/RagA family TonB-linked outer membrane protein, partial [Bacteroidetes bacterium]|nr:SusC/RagA family TonB-linked outer membrane protein [Bacteroidota bacterium]
MKKSKAYEHTPYVQSKLKFFFLAMKLTVFLFVICLHAYSNVFTQEKIDISVKNVELKKLFNIIQSKTAYRFLYYDDCIPKNKKITLDMTGAPISQVLDQALVNTSLKYNIMDQLVVISPVAADIRDIIISGKVTDQNGNPLGGASVTLEGTKIGTTTDAQGNFNLSVPDRKGNLLISYVGYMKAEVNLNNSGSVINVSLKLNSSASADDVVVVGYARQKKIDLTGAVDQISGEQIQNRPVTNVSGALQGVMANLNVYTTGAGGQPDATKSINIRGYTGLGDLAGPLILVDGVPADINTISPDDIESITMLKDIASSAIYGSRAPNGVLLIVTKHGKKGQPFQVSYRNNFSVTNPINNLQMMNSYDFANLYNEAAKNSGYGNPLFSATRISQIQQYMKDPSSVPVVLPSRDSSSWDGYGTGVANNDWYKVFMKKNVLSQQHNLSLDGGSEKITYHIGTGIQDQNANLNFFNGYKYKTYNFRANVRADVTKWMAFGIETSFAQTNDKVPYSGDVGYNWYFDIARYWPILPVYGPNGGLLSSTQAAFMASNNRYQAYQANDSWIKGNLDLNPAKGWMIHGDYAYNSYNKDSTDYQGQYYQSTPKNPHLLTNRGTPTITRQARFNHYHSYNIYTSYEKNLGDHYFKVLVGQQEEYQYYSSFLAANTLLYDPSLPALN